jgi:hypothetical protein
MDPHVLEHVIEDLAKRVLAADRAFGRLRRSGLRRAQGEPLHLGAKRGLCASLSFGGRQDPVGIDLVKEPAVPRCASSRSTSRDHRVLAAI